MGKWTKEETDWGKVESDSLQLLPLIKRVGELPPNRKITATYIVKKVREKGFIGINNQNYGELWKTFLPGINDRTITLDNWYESVKSCKNNSTGVKIYKTFPALIETIKEILLEKKIPDSDEKDEPSQRIFSNWLTGMTTSASRSKSILVGRQFLGLYKCYLHSPYDDSILSYPLLLRENPHSKKLEVLLGNKNTKYRYTGVPIMAGSDTLCFSVIDFYDNITEIMQVTVSVPHTHIVKSSLLRGTFSSIDTLRQPICGRIVLQRVNESVSLEDFENFPNEKYKYDNRSIDSAIIYYLKDRIQSLITCERTYDDLDGLIIEKNMIRDSFSDFQGFGEQMHPTGDYKIYSRQNKKPNEGYSIQGFWISDFIGREEHAIEIYCIKQSGNDIKCMFQHFKKSTEDKNFRGKGVGFCKGNKITMSYDMLDPKIMTNGSFILQVRDDYPRSVLVGNFFEIESNKIITSHSDKLVFRKIDLKDEQARKLWQNEDFIFKDYDEVAKEFDISPVELSEEEENNCNYIMDL